MDFKNRHPLNAIEGYESLSMLEALIPFVDYSLKLPLALFLKFSETRLIIKCFQSNNNLVRLGLHNPCNSPLEMICSFTGMSPDMLKMLFSMMDGGSNSMFSNLFNHTPDINTCKSDDDTMAFGSNFSFSPEDISKAMNMFQSMQSGFDNQDNNASLHHSNASEVHHSDDFEHNIQQLFTEYDLAQAENYDSTYNNTFKENDSYSHHDN